MKAVACVSKEPAVKAAPSAPETVRDPYGRNTIRWSMAVEGRPEGPPSVCVAINDGAARTYLSKEEALALAVAIVESADTL